MTNIEPNPDFQSGMSAARMTQKEVAARAGISCQFLNDILRERRGPSVETARAVLDAIDADERVRAFCVGRWMPDVKPWQALLSPPSPLPKGSEEEK